jgi:hypothetical protein
MANAGWHYFTMPTCVAPGDYLMRVELLALHSASSAGGAQFYMEVSNLASLSFPDLRLTLLSAPKSKSPAPAPARAQTTCLSRARTRPTTRASWSASTTARATRTRHHTRFLDPRRWCARRVRTALVLVPAPAPAPARLPPSVRHRAAQERLCMRSAVEQDGLERRAVPRVRVRRVGNITRSVCRRRVGVWPGVCSSRKWCIEHMRLMMSHMQLPTHYALVLFILSRKISDCTSAYDA